MAVNSNQKANMTKQELNAALCAVLTTALETEPTPFPQSMAYLALGADMSKWEAVRGVLAMGQLATLDYDTITLTSKGRELARKIEAHMQAVRMAA